MLSGLLVATLAMIGGAAPAQQDDAAGADRGIPEASGGNPADNAPDTTAEETPDAPDETAEPAPENPDEEAPPSDEKPPPLPKLKAPIWLVLDGERAGPFDARQLADLARDEKLTRTTLAWQNGMEEWRPAVKIPVLNVLIQDFGPAPDPYAILRGTWSARPYSKKTKEQGMVDAVLSYKIDLLIFERGGVMKTYVAKDLTGWIMGKRVTIPTRIEGRGSYRAEMFSPDTIQVKPDLQVAEYTVTSQEVKTTGPKGEPKVEYVPTEKVTPKKLTTPMLLKIIDENTLQDEEGRLYRKQ